MGSKASRMGSKVCRMSSGRMGSQALVEKKIEFSVLKSQVCWSPGPDFGRNAGSIGPNGLAESGLTVWFCKSHVPIEKTIDAHRTAHSVSFLWMAVMFLLCHVILPAFSQYL